MKNDGYTYIETIISMTLISIIGLCISNCLSIALAKNQYVRKNYYLNITAENLLNVAYAALDNDDSFDEALISQNQELFYPDKFSFVIRANEISEDLFVIKEPFFTLNPDNKDVPPIDTEIKFDDNNKNRVKYLFDTAHTEGKANCLITIDIFDKNDKYLKRVIKIY